MIFDVQSYALIFSDILYSLSAGFVVGFIYQVLSVFLYRSKTAVFLRDILTGIAFAFVVFSFAVSFTNYPILRWYNVAGAVFGAVLFMPCFSKIGQLAISIIFVILHFFFSKTVYMLSEYFKNKFWKNKEKKQKITPKNDENLLKNETVLLYN